MTIEIEPSLSHFRCKKLLTHFGGRGGKGIGVDRSKMSLDLHKYKNLSNNKLKLWYLTCWGLES